MPDNNQGAGQSQSLFDNVQATGDISVTGNVTQNIFSSTDKEVSFFKPNLKSFSPSEFPTPEIATNLLSILKKNHIVVLSEGVNVDKAALARHLAVLQSKHLEDLGEEVTVKEWYRSSDPSDIKYELEVYKTCKILILTQATPQYLLGYNLSDIQTIASKRSHFIVVTTELPFAAWHLFDSCLAWWHIVTDKDVEDCQRLISVRSHEESLSEWYHRQLNSKEQLLAIGLSLFDGLFDDQFFSALEAVVEYSWKKRDANLQALDYCDLDNLRGYFDFIETETQEAIIRIRYPKQRLTCLKIAWKTHRRQILSVLPILVNLVKGTVEGVDRELYSSPIRQEKLRQTISEAISGIGLISRLGAGSREAVNDSLIQLAASRDTKVQAVAAQSIAAWRDQDNQVYIGNQEKIDIDGELFSIFESWIPNPKYSVSSTLDREFQQRAQSQGKSDVQEEYKDQQKNQDQNHESQEKPEHYIEATLAIVVGYASQYDPKGNLSETLYERFKKLPRASKSNPMVRDGFAKYTLRMVVGRHLSKVQDFLLKTILNNGFDDLIPEVAESLSTAYRYNPVLVVALLKQWENWCLTENIFSDNPEELKRRNSLMATTAVTIENIFASNHDKYSEELTIGQAFITLLNFLNFEGEEKARRFLLQLISSLIKNKFNKLKPQDLEKLFKIISLEESTKIILKALNTIYLEQRSNLTGGDETFEIDTDTINNSKKNQYPIWLVPEERKSTLIEDILLNWIKNDLNPQCQKFAALAYMGFIREFEEEERAAIDSIWRNRFYADKLIENNQFVRKPPRKAYLPKKPKRLFYYDSILIPWLITRSAKIYFKGISNLLPEAAKYRFRPPRLSPAYFFIEKLKSKNDDELTKVSKFLRRGIRVSILVPIFGTLFIFLGALIRYYGVQLDVSRRNSDFTTSGSSRQQELSTVPEENSPDETGSLNNPFEQFSYPLDVCGDPMPTDPSLYPVNLYPVFINYNDAYLEQVESSVCRDAFVKIRKASGENSIQVASFLTYEKANLFKDFIGEKFSGVEVGKPSKFDIPPNSSKPVSISSKGAIQFPVGATKTLIEANLASSTLDRYTFSAMANQKTVIAMRSDSEQVNLLIKAPSGEFLRVSKNPEDTGVMSWTGNLPMDGTYTLDVITQAEQSSYRLFLEVDP